MKAKTFLLATSVAWLGFTSCSPTRDNAMENRPEETTPATNKYAEKYKTRHPYGGWHCPDNLGGFPPMDLSEVTSLDVIEGRLPTQEETRSSKSLIYIDPEEHPNAQALDVDLPRVAEFHSPYTGRTERVIVIQAVVVDEDTIVGFRYPSGGNGSAWYGEMSFLDWGRVDDLGNAPYVHLKRTINTSRNRAWESVTFTEYANQLRTQFQEQHILRNDWSQNNYTELNYQSEHYVAKGMIADMWGGIYLQIDYDYPAHTQTEKILILPGDDSTTAEIQIVMGPYSSDLPEKTAEWDQWLNSVKANAEDPDGC